MGDLLNLNDEDRLELRRNAPFIERTSHLIRGLPLVGVFAAIARSGISSADIDDLIDLLNMISHEYWGSVGPDEEEGIKAVLRELGGDGSC